MAASSDMGALGAPVALAPGRGGDAPASGARHELVLLVLLTLEISVFGMTGRNFVTWTNAIEIVRVSVELGLLALALTPIIVSGGIDLSVGSMMGLCAVTFGLLAKQVGLPIPAAVALTLAVGAAGGALNALLVTRLRIPPLIVTLGTYSLFRGLAEGMTAGVKNFTGLPPTFLQLGQGYFLFDLLPMQLPLFLAVALVYYGLLHRTTIGRSLYAIGLSSEGARHAGIPVRARLGLVYTLCGMVAALAAVVYVAHLGQAKADAGTSYELMAITAVVLGGTSIFGGRGTIIGTLLGLFTIATLQNGLRLSDEPAELGGILVGALLIGAILVNQIVSRGGRTR